MSDPAENTLESLSAFVDGEVSPDEMRFLLKRVGEDAELRARWQRHCIAGLCLRKELDAFVDVDFATRTMQRLEIPAQPEKLAFPLFKAVGGFAIAAGVAAIALFSMGPATDNVAPTAASVPLLANETGMRASDLNARIAVQPVTNRVTTTTPIVPLASASFDPRAERYFLGHGTAVSGSPRGGFVPYIYAAAAPEQVAVPPQTAVDR